MAQVVLDRVWFNDPSTPEDYITVFTEGAFDEEDAVLVEVRGYASGRNRAVGRAGSSRTVNCTVKECSLRDVAWLRARRGKLVCLRDRTGRKIWGVYPSIKPTEYKSMSAFSVALAITEVTYDESVA